MKHLDTEWIAGFRRVVPLKEQTRPARPLMCRGGSYSSCQLSVTILTSLNVIRNINRNDTHEYL